jgi:hypothetical protein
MVRSVHAPVEGCVSLLSLIPHLIKQSVAVYGGGLWVWLGGTLLLLGSNMVRSCVAGGLAHCWVLRGHLLWVLFSGPLLVRLSNGSLFGLVAMVRCWGVVVC